MRTSAFIVSKAVDRSALLAAGVMAAAALCLSGCGEHANKADEAKASSDLNQASDALTTAVKKTGAALGHEADAAKPSLAELGAKADRGVAKLADATGDAAARAGAAINKAGQKADAAAHNAGDDARDHADKTAEKD